MNEKRMNKNELIKLIDTLKIDKNEFWILSSGALVLREIYDDAGDLDIAVTDKGLEELNNNYNLIKKDNGWYIVTDKIECIQNNMDEKKEKIGEYYLQDMLDYLKFLEESNRQKDKDRIDIVKSYIRRNYGKCNRS